MDDELMTTLGLELIAILPSPLLMKVIASSCLADFLEHLRPRNLAGQTPVGETFIRAASSSQGICQPRPDSCLASSIALRESSTRALADSNLAHRPAHRRQLAFKEEIIRELRAVRALGPKRRGDSWLKEERIAFLLLGPLAHAILQPSTNLLFRPELIS